MRYGDEMGVPTPVNRLLNDTLMSLTRGDLPLDTFAGKPKKFLDEFHKTG